MFYLQISVFNIYGAYNATIYYAKGSTAHTYKIHIITYGCIANPLRSIKMVVGFCSLTK